MATIKLSEARAEMKKERASVCQAIKVLASYMDTCPSVKKVLFSKEFTLSCSHDIYVAMKVDQTYIVKVTDKETGEKVEKERVRKPSADLCLRWFISCQEANAELYKKFIADKKDK